MKSEIEEFWEMIISDDFELQMEGYDKWTEYEQNHPEYIKKLSKKLSKKFYSNYQKVNFHDFQVIDVIYKFNRNKVKISEIRILLYDYYREYGKDLYFSVSYKGVEEYSIKIPSEKDRVFWGNDVFEVVGKNLVKHRVKCTDGINLCISFKNISIKRGNKEKLM